MKVFLIKHIQLVVFVSSLFIISYGFAQPIKFNKVIDEKVHSYSFIFDITQDQQGYIWFTSVAKGLQRYDGKNIISFSHDNDNPNTTASNLASALAVDSAGFIWVGTLGFGLDRYDIAKNKFTHFRSDPKNSRSLGNDSVFCLSTDRAGNLWVGTLRGVDRFDKKKEIFYHYEFDEKMKTLSPDEGVIVTTIYEDKKGILWIGWGNVFNAKKGAQGGLYKLDPKSGKFTAYHNIPGDTSSLSNDNVFSIFEDSKGNFWIGTNGDGLHSMDRATGKFTRYPYNPANPEKFSRPPVNKVLDNTLVTFITEDVHGRLWIGSSEAGINVFDPGTKKLTHYGGVDGDKTNRYAKDTIGGFTGNGAYHAFTSRDGLLWITGFPSDIYNVNFSKINVPFVSTNTSAGAFYLQEDKNILWMQSDSGILRKNLNNGEVKLFKHDPKNKNSLVNKDVMAMRGDGAGNIWMATHWNGVEKFNISTEHFTHINFDKNNPRSLVHDSTHTLFFDQQNFLWIGTHKGLSKMDIKTGLCKNYINDVKDSLSLSPGSLYSIAQEKNGTMWIAGIQDINRLDEKTGKFKRYPIGNITYNLNVDASGIVWAGGEAGLYYLDTKRDAFKKYINPVFPGGLPLIAGMIEDDKRNLWLSTNESIIKLNPGRTILKIYNASHGVRPISNIWMENIKAKDGRLFLGSLKGYYSFYPDQLSDQPTLPMLQFTDFKIGSEKVLVDPDGVLQAPVWQTNNIKLNHDQNTFSFDFNAIDYKSTGDIKFLYKLDNYDDEWRDIGSEHKATFFNIPPGKYTLHIKAVNSEGSIAEQIMAISVSPPWWKTWWAYVLYAILFIIAGYIVYRYQKYYIVKRERERSQQKELVQAREIEKAYKELKTTQAQLIQSEKMASLGELTAGIAHEIQNPLNFVNNFSEVNSELIDEMQQELKAGNNDEAITISNNIKENQEKINHHGKRADAIVKGMLQHSRSSSGVKEPTDINALANEYLRLAYHGLRAKDKSFNATMKTHFDESIGKISIIPQDIGRVILNLITNAFYVVDEKKKEVGDNYEPTVSISSKKMGDKVEISVKDNGNGIPQNVMDKIFQPFFTTKPTGQGTGLGLSLSYDIVKAHGGELRVETKKGEGSDFIIKLSIV